MKTRLTAVACGALALLTVQGAAPAPDDPLIGLWEYQTTFPTGLRGEIAIARHGDDWSATLGGARAQFHATGAEVRLVFPRNGGVFRGEMNGDVLEGFWVRPAVTDDPRYPIGATQGYAMPLILKPSGRDRWRATVRPLDDPFTLYLKVFRGADGTLKAAFRNPEMHSHGPAMQLSASRDGDAVRFSAQPDPAQPQVHLDATLLHKPDRVSMMWSDIGRTIELTRRTPQQAVDFFPRPPGSPRYVYRKPPTTNDGWTTARAGELGVDEAALTRAVQRIIDVDPAAARGAWLIHGMAVAYRGKLVLDEYFYGYDRDTPHDTRSASKTFSSVMLGAAMMRGTKIGPETKLYDLVAPMGPFANPDPRKADITLANVMTHTTGLACDDNDETSPGNEDTMEFQRAQPNWWKFELDLPMLHAPGTHYAYCSGGINLMGAALTNATGTWLPMLFDRTVAKPLQFGPYYWNLMPNGEGYQGGGVFVRPRDFLKIGQAFLDGGVWNGRRIVTEDWVKLSTGPRTHISPETTGLSGDAFREVYWEGDDGYAWHMAAIKSGDQVYRGYHANGNGGQLLIVVPQFDLVVMFTAGNYQQGLWNNERDDIVGGLIIPAITHQTALPQGK